MLQDNKHIKLTFSLRYNKDDKTLVPSRPGVFLKQDYKLTKNTILKLA
jgi:hypothetical protein